MPRMQFGLSAEERARGDLPQLPVINMFAEQAPTEATSVVLQSRPGLTDREADIGSDVAALFTRDGVLGGVQFGLASGTLYSGTNALGLVDGSGPPSIAGFEDRLFVTAGATLWTYSASAFAPVAFPDGANVRKVLIGASRAIAIREDTETYYFSPVLAGSFDGLDFASAESQPDRLRDALFIDDVLVLFGSGTIEFHPNTGDPDLPFQPLEGRVFERGIRATGCAAEFDGTFAWVGDDNVVYLNGQGPTPISNAGLQQKIEASATCAVFTFQLDGQEFLALRLDTQTYVYGNRNRLWSEFASYGVTNWLPRCFAGGVFGCSDGRVAEWGDDHEDFGSVMERRFRGGFPVNAGGIFVDSLRLRCEVGQSPYLTGDYVAPQVEMRTSDDAGRTFSAWDSAALGVQGDSRAQPHWTALGMASQPGFLAEFRVTAPVSWRVSECLVNEGYGGR